ncbi:MAG: response regulator transcription factor [Lachnospiraceae bacterium]|nr:response regulator transcription factor [Lachnospiraceae bacterium]
MHYGRKKCFLSKITYVYLRQRKVILMRIAICDDENYIVESLKEKLDKILRKWCLEYEIVCFNTGIDMLIDIEIGGMFDIIFLDIELGTYNGINIAKKLRENYEIFELIIISQYQDYYRDIFEVDAKWFLDKPFSDEVLEKALKKVVANISKAEDIIEFAFKKTLYRLSLREIMYIESDRRKVHIYCNDNHIYEYYEKLDKLEEKFSKGNLKYIRISKSYLINVLYVKRYSYENIELRNGEIFKISQGKRECIRDIFMEKAF